MRAATLYLCTDARRERADLAEFVDAALAGGVDIVQLRDKGSPGEQRFGPLEARQEIEALAVMGLAPPIGWEEVKTRYKTLAKKYHPDTNKDDKKAEELLKKINLAYSILKISYQHYMKLDE